MENVEKKPKLLIYAHYYLPDTASTGQILSELAEGLLDYFDITVICVVPSYLGIIEDSYKNSKFYNENINGVKVLRIRVPEFSKDNKISRIKNIISYFLGAIIATIKVGNFDYVFSISQPPILGGLLGVWGKMLKKAKYIYNIQDFNPEQILAVNYSRSKLIIKILMILDKFSCRKSDLVITVGRDLIETHEKRFNNENTPKSALINNWIDENEIFPISDSHERVVAFKRRYNLDGKFVIMYSGNIGLYYDLENLIKVMNKFKTGTKTKNGLDVVFAFVGAGSVLEDLKDFKEKNDMFNAIFIPYQDKSELIYSLNSADVHWCVNTFGIKGVSCPSKYYGIAAVGKPVLGVLEEGTEIRSLIEYTNGGLCCNPGDYDQVEKNIKWFIDNAGNGEVKMMGNRSYEYLISHLTKEISVNKYKDAIISI